MEFLSPLSSWIPLFYSKFNHLVLLKPSEESLNPKLFKDALKIISCIYFVLLVTWEDRTMQWFIKWALELETWTHTTASISLPVNYCVAVGHSFNPSELWLPRWYTGDSISAIHFHWSKSLTRPPLPGPRLALCSGPRWTSQPHVLTGCCRRLGLASP